MAEQSLRWCAWCRSAVKPAEHDDAVTVVDEKDKCGTRRQAVITREFPEDRCPHCGNATTDELPDTEARAPHCPSVWGNK